MAPIKWVPEFMLKIHVSFEKDAYKKPFSTAMRIARSFQRVPVPDLPESLVASRPTDRSMVVAGRPIPDIRAAMDHVPGGSMILISVIDGRNVPKEVSDKGGVMTIGTTIPSLKELHGLKLTVGAREGGVYYMIGGKE